MDKRKLFGAFLLIIWVPMNAKLLLFCSERIKSSIIFVSFSIFWIVVLTFLAGLFTLRFLRLRYSTYFKTIALSALIFAGYTARNTILNKELVKHDFDDTLGAFFEGLMFCGLYLIILLGSWMFYATKFEERG